MDDQFRFFPPQASTIAPRVDNLFLFLLLVSACIVMLVFTLVVVFAIRYRRRNPDDVGADLPSPRWMEITWTVIPTLITLVMFGWGAKLYLEMSRPPANAMEIAVIGKQWMWELQQPNGKKEINALHIPINTPIKLVLTSHDVIHDFYIPAFRTKQDVIPGRYSIEWFTATQLGSFHLFCSEYCGTQHSHMGGWVTVMTQADYSKWLGSEASDDDVVAAGGRIFAERGCIQCHGQQGPTLAGLYGTTVPLSDGTTVTADDAYLRESILYPQAKIVLGYKPIMPSYREQLTEGQLYQLIAYIKSLRAAADTQPAAGSPTFATTAPSSTTQGAAP
jgi:cytochrome c oxidase subunit 2